ncbi:unnamed protein product [Linum tenue]|uniref:Ribosomal protein L33 n=1 Tax=Linum tenue TaxID=586396 RepID=A0AAV0NTL6_9ROSI|nr:unnamed protein product [Linum tenue]
MPKVHIYRLRKPNTRPKPTRILLTSLDYSANPFPNTKGKPKPKGNKTH